MRIFTGILLLAGLAFFSGCESAELKSFEKKVEADIECRHNPVAQVPKVRKYALEKLYDVTEEERKIILTVKPSISSSFDDSEYAYIWKIKEGMFIEVLTTPTPFLPIEVFRTSKKRYE